ncbi:MAG: transposase [Alphaproteobacteria bacterium]|nr:transposase [Alphaproteobacteria bacterium]
MIRKVCSANYVDIISENASPGSVHILISVPPHLSVSKIVQYMRGKDDRKLQGEFQESRKTVLGTISMNKKMFCCNIRAGKCKGGTKMYRGARAPS